MELHTEPIVTLRVERRDVEHSDDTARVLTNVPLEDVTSIEEVIAEADFPDEPDENDVTVTLLDAVGFPPGDYPASDKEFDFDAALRVDKQYREVMKRLDDDEPWRTYLVCLQLWPDVNEWLIPDYFFGSFYDLDDFLDSCLRDWYGPYNVEEYYRSETNGEFEGEADPDEVDREAYANWLSYLLTWGTYGGRLYVIRWE